MDDKESTRLPSCTRLSHRSRSLDLSANEIVEITGLADFYIRTIFRRFCVSTAFVRYVYISRRLFAIRYINSDNSKTIAFFTKCFFFFIYAEHVNRLDQVCAYY